ncbi:type 1 fimbrial protein [Yokenella regensburgei]|uniref:fimbrial protein n=1 Tax=Yokenella regensburgei TaxID=158877 RepID=UPI003F14222A
MLCYLKVFPLMLLSLIFFGTCAYAGCGFNQTAEYTANATRNFTVPFVANTTISVPPGTAIGQVIYQQEIQIKNFEPVQIKCDSADNFFFSYTYGVLPLPVSTTDSNIYETGVAGIGIKFTVNSAVNVPYLSTSISHCAHSLSCVPTTSWYYPVQFALVKTANTVAAGMISANNLPSILFNLGQKNSMVTLHNVKLTGGITVTVPTCDVTPASGSMSIKMGVHDVDAFSGIGTGTEWKDASIMLMNCARFYGTTSASIASFNGSTNTSMGTLANNEWALTLAPHSAIINATQGIMDIDNDPLRATGIGIQLSTSSSTSGVVDLSQAVKGALPKDGSPNVTIPLFARYVQTQNNLSAGTANGKLVYTVTYQ